MSPSAPPDYAVALRAHGANLRRRVGELQADAERVQRHSHAMQAEEVALRSACERLRQGIEAERVILSGSAAASDAARADAVACGKEVAKGRQMCVALQAEVDAGCIEAGELVASALERAHCQAAVLMEQLAASCAAETALLQRSVEQAESKCTSLLHHFSEESDARQGRTHICASTQLLTACKELSYGLKADKMDCEAKSGLADLGEGVRQQKLQHEVLLQRIEETTTASLREAVARAQRDEERDVERVHTLRAKIRKAQRRAELAEGASKIFMPVEQAQQAYANSEDFGIEITRECFYTGVAQRNASSLGSSSSSSYTDIPKRSFSHGESATRCTTGMQRARVSSLPVLGALRAVDDDIMAAAKASALPKRSSGLSPKASRQLSRRRFTE